MILIIHPFAVRVAVDELRAGCQRVVGRRHGAGQRREQVADSLDRLDDPERLGLLERTAGVGQLDEHDVAQLVGGVLGDPDGRLIAVDPDPLVVAGVPQVGR